MHFKNLVGMFSVCGMFLVWFWEISFWYRFFIIIIKKKKFSGFFGVKIIGFDFN